MSSTQKKVTNQRVQDLPNKQQNQVNPISNKSTITLFDWNNNQTKLFIGLSLFFTGLVYYLLHTRFVLYNGDDAWTMTRLYNYMTMGSSMDTIFRAIETDERIQIFNMLFNQIYGYYLAFFGWTKSNAHILNTVLMSGTAVVWFYILRGLKFSLDLSAIFALTLLLFPAYFGSANLLRTDPLTFLLASSSFLLFIRQKYFFAALFLMLSIETHPMGIIGGFYILAYVLTQWTYFFEDKKRLAKISAQFLLGIGVGIGYYLFLHWDVLTWERFSKTLIENRNRGKELPNYIITYFLQTEWYLHVWELFLMIGTVGVYVGKKLYKKNTFVWVFFLSLILSTFISGRPNRVYMVFLFPAFHLMLLYSAEQLNKLKAMTFVLAGAFTLYYGGIYWMNKSYDLNQITSTTIEAIPNKNIPVVGMADNWFAAKEHPFYLIYNSIHDLPEQNLKELYLIENDYLHIAPISLQLEKFVLDQGLTKDPLISKRKKHYLKTIAYFKTNYDCEEITTFAGYQDEKGRICYCKEK